MKPTIIIIIVAAWLLIPTGTPDDVITWFFIAHLGLELYLIVILLIILLLWAHEVKFKQIDRTVKRLWNGKKP